MPRFLTAANTILPLIPELRVELDPELQPLGSGASPARLTTPRPRRSPAARAARGGPLFDRTTLSQESTIFPFAGYNRVSTAPEALLHVMQLSQNRAFLDRN